MLAIPAKCGTQHSLVMHHELILGLISQVLTQPACVEVPHLKTKHKRKGGDNRPKRESSRPRLIQWCSHITLHFLNLFNTPATMTTHARPFTKGLESSGDGFESQPRTLTLGLNSGLLGRKFRVGFGKNVLGRKTRRDQKDTNTSRRNERM